MVLNWNIVREIVRKEKKKEDEEIKTQNSNGIFKFSFATFRMRNVKFLFANVAMFDVRRTFVVLSSNFSNRFFLLIWVWELN